NPTTSGAPVAVLASGPGSFTAGSTTSAAAVGGVATFSNLRLNAAGSYTIVASSTGLGGATSSSFNITSAAADHLAFGQQPTNASFTITPAAAATLTITAPAAVNPATPFTITVTAKDAFNNVATGYMGTVHFTRSDANESSVVPPDYTFVAGDNGTHTFTNGV